MPEAGRTCIWGCGRSDFNREHVVGQQIAALLGLEYPVRLIAGHLAGPEEDSVELVLENRVCKTCNNGWMRKTDNRVVAILGSAFAGEHEAAFSANDHSWIAKWAIKVAMLLEVRAYDLSVEHPDRYPTHEPGHLFLPRDNLTALWRHQTPPKRTEVWMGALDNELVHPFFISMGGPIILREVERGYFSLFTVGRLLFRVTGWQLDWSGEPPATVIEPQPPSARGLLQIWPVPPDPAHWPPERRLLNDDIGALAGTDPPWG